MSKRCHALDGCMKYQSCKENFIILIFSLFIFLYNPFVDEFVILHKGDPFSFVQLHYSLEIISMQLNMNDLLRLWLFICIPNDECVVLKNILVQFDLYKVAK